MSDAEHEPPHRPAHDATPEKVVSSAGFSFIPPIHLDSRAALRLASKFALSITPSSVQLESNQWIYIANVHRAIMKITTTETQFNTEISAIPSVAIQDRSPQETYEQKIQSIVDIFAEEFHPQVVVESHAVLRSLLTVQGDSRAFIGGRLMGMPHEKIAPIGRPLHGIGLRLYFPQYQIEGADPPQKEDWSVDVKVESWLADPRKVFIEIEARWQVPKPWSQDSSGEIAAHLQKADDFVQTRVIPFLKQDGEQQ
jgi:hypothetical protein